MAAFAGTEGSACPLRRLSGVIRITAHYTENTFVLGGLIMKSIRTGLARGVKCAQKA